jgi:hypothetical protein
MALRGRIFICDEDRVAKARITTRPSLPPTASSPDSILVWWKSMVRKAYLKAIKRPIVVDSGASHDQPVEAGEGRIAVYGICLACPSRWRIFRQPPASETRSHPASRPSSD